MSNAIPNGVRRKVIERDESRCRYCGIDVEYDHSDRARRLSLDHIVPKSKHGPATMANLVVACEPCNQAKGDTIIDPVTGQELAGEALVDLLGLLSVLELPPRPAPPLGRGARRTKTRDERRHEWLVMPDHGTHRRWLHGCRCKSCGRARAAYEVARAVPA